MALQIDRANDPHRKEREMAQQGNAAGERLYETVDGELVREGDPRGAFLAYGPGDPVRAEHADALRKLTGRTGDVAAQAYTDEGVRAELQARQANDRDTGRAASPPLLHDQLATELADEQRRIANAPDPQVRADAQQLRMEAAGSGDGEVTTFEVWAREDGTLVHKGDPAGTTLAYAAGDRIADGDVDAFKALGDPPAGDDSPEGGDPAATKATVKPTNKSGASAANKSGGAK